MKIAIIADIHDNFHNLVLALKIIKEKEIEQIIFLGDFINNGIAGTLAASKIPIFAIFGNNDGDKAAIVKTSLDHKSNLKMSGNTYDFLEFDGKKIFITHHPELAEPMAKSGEYDAVFYAHNHLKNLDKIGECIVCNPGEIAAQKTGKATFAIYDTGANEIESIKIDGAITAKTEQAKKHLAKL